MDAVWLHNESQISKSREIAVVETNADGKHYLHYILKDHLGSWTTITDSDGAVEQELSYDAWGNRRDPDTWRRNWYDPALEEPMFDRGYTGHEHLYAFGLINMNGRCYDPKMSSFLSVDAYVQSPDNAQNFNRYAYCLNNPLKYTDPSGWRMTGAYIGTPIQGTSNWGTNFAPVYEPRDFGLLQLPENNEPIFWRAGNEMGGRGGQTNGYGGVGGWVKNNQTGDVYYDKNATTATQGFIDIRYTQGQTYYGLFGETYDLNTIEGRLGQCFDDCIINYEEFSQSLKDPNRDPYESDPINKKTDFSKVSKFERNNNIHRNNNYNGGEAVICIPNNKELLQLKLSCISDLTPKGDIPQAIRTFDLSASTSFEKGYQLYFYDINGRAQAWVNFTTKSSRNAFLSNFYRTFGYY